MKPSTYHTEWQDKRINFILSKYPKEFFKNKSILELGAFNGYIGAHFQSWGANVCCVEGRKENAKQIKIDYPELRVECDNLDIPYWKWGKWDIIINFGLYYHLENFHEKHLTNCLNNCNLMFFESVIFDNNQPVIYFREEQGIDQSLGFTGGTPSTSYVENIFKRNDVSYLKFSPTELNTSNYHHYDWVDKNSNTFNQYSRRFWIIETNQ